MKRAIGAAGEASRAGAGTGGADYSSDNIASVIRKFIPPTRYSGCGPGGGAVSDPAGCTEIVGVFAAARPARAAFFKTVARALQLDDVHREMFVRFCGCADCGAFVARKTAEYTVEMDAADAALSRLEGALTAARKSGDAAAVAAADAAYTAKEAEMRDELMDADFASLRQWGKEGEEVWGHEESCYAALLEGDPRAQAFYCLGDYINSDGKGGLRFYQDGCDGDIIEEALMQLKTVK